MPKVISGTKALRTQNDPDRPKVELHKAHGGNISKIRCTFCGTLAHPRPNAKGGTTLHCAGCGRSYSVKTL